ncbi:hypothetical protein [Rhizobium sp. S96]|uniref:hypothetical protein n=1 Tax=Rhizobium sp. S96 TaxID=3055140 RepID=UPI0025AAA09D|nr:hypothetical protein [Rhizobium sp. S96]MDM9619251.1 hypothetical protein [Rhizobium sp. S96]
MSLLNFVDLDDDDFQSVADVVRRWCSDDNVDPESERGRAAMRAAVEHALRGDSA